jgi:hypothetical protein
MLHDTALMLCRTNAMLHSNALCYVASPQCDVATPQCDIASTQCDIAPHECYAASPFATQHRADAT